MCKKPTNECKHPIHLIIIFKIDKKKMKSCSKSLILNFPFSQSCHWACSVDVTKTKTNPQCFSEKSK